MTMSTTPAQATHSAQKSLGWWLEERLAIGGIGFSGREALIEVARVLRPYVVVLLCTLPLLAVLQFPIENSWRYGLLPGPGFWIAWAKLIAQKPMTPCQGWMAKAKSPPVGLIKMLSLQTSKPSLSRRAFITTSTYLLVVLRTPYLLQYTLYILLVVRSTPYYSV